MRNNSPQNRINSSSSSSQNNQRLTMEQFWKDLTFPTTTISLQSQHNSDAMFQDFMGAGSSSNINKETPPPPSPSPPSTAPCFNSALDDFDYDNRAPAFNVSSAYSSEAIGGSPPISTVSLFAFHPSDQREFCRDRRNKRLMKNRESAARSRARKQAYTNEMELEVAHLMAENEKLKKQYEELRLAMVAQHSTKKTLQRTSTAPF